MSHVEELLEGRAWRVVHGDALEWMPRVPEAAAALVMTDPPYGHNQSDGDLASHMRRALGDKDAPEHRRPILNDGPEANDLLRAVLPMARKALVPGGNCCVCCAGGGA